jgi:hypothetical protein
LNAIDERAIVRGPVLFPASGPLTAASRTP